MNLIEKGVIQIKDKIDSGQTLDQKDFIIALTATLIEEASVDLKNGKKNEDKHE